MILFVIGGVGLCTTILAWLCVVIYRGENADPPPMWMFYPIPPSLVCIMVGMAWDIWHLPY